MEIKELTPNHALYKLGHLYIAEIQKTIQLQQTFLAPYVKKEDVGEFNAQLQQQLENAKQNNQFWKLLIERIKQIKKFTGRLGVNPQPYQHNNNTDIDDNLITDDGSLDFI